MAKDFLIMKQFIFWTKDRNMTNFIMRKVYNTLFKNWILPYEYISLIWQYTHQLIRNQSFGGKDLYKFVTNDTHRLLSCWWKRVDYQIKLPFIRRNMNGWKLLHFDVSRETSNHCLRIIYHNRYKNLCSENILFKTFLSNRITEIKYVKWWFGQISEFCCIVWIWLLSISI